MNFYIFIFTYVCVCILNDYSNVVRKQQEQYLSLNPSQQLDKTCVIEELMDVSFELDIDLDPRQPILEREFAEVMIRCIAESACRYVYVVFSRTYLYVNNFTWKLKFYA